MATSARLYHCQQFGAIPGSSPGQLTDQQVLAKLHALGVRFVRFSKSKIPFDPRHRTWGLELDALLRTHADPNLHVGWIPASVWSRSTRQPTIAPAGRQDADTWSTATPRPAPTLTAGLPRDAPVMFGVRDLSSYTTLPDFVLRWTWAFVG